MITNKVVNKIKDMVNNNNKFIECRRRIEELEPELMIWVNDSAQTVALEEAAHLVENASNQQGAQLYETIIGRVKSKIVSCIIAGYIANEVYHTSKWNEDYGIDGQHIQEKKLKAFIEGTLDAKYYKGLDKKNKWAKKALENFKKRQDSDTFKQKVMDHMKNIDSEEKK